MNYTKCNKCGAVRNYEIATDCPICVVPPEVKKLYPQRSPKTPKSLDEYVKSIPLGVFTKSRQVEVVIQKRIAVRTLRGEFKLSFPTIAKILKYQDHSSIIHLWQTR